MSNSIYLQDENGNPVPATCTGGAIDVNLASGAVDINPLANVVSLGTQSSAGDTTITTGGTAKLLFAGAVPVNGWAVYNPDATNDLWVSDSTTAAANGQGSIRIAANGGGYETPAGYKPTGQVSIVGAVTAQKITARKW